MCVKTEIGNLHFFHEENAFRDWKELAMAGKVGGHKIKLIMIDAWKVLKISFFLLAFLIAFLS